MKILAYMLVLISTPTWGKVTIHVGDSGNQPPYTDGKATGLSAKTVSLLNEVQEKYHFIYKRLPSKRMRKLILTGNLHMVAFDNQNWGWDKSKVDGSIPLVQNKDLYFYLKKHAPINPKEIIGNDTTAVVNGFHYKFAGYKNDLQTYKKFKMVAIENESLVFDFVIAGRAPLGIASSSILNFFKINRSEEYKKITIHPVPDQTYIRQFIVSKKSPLPVEEFNQLLLKHNFSSKLYSLFSEFGLESELLLRAETSSKKK